MATAKMKSLATRFTENLRVLRAKLNLSQEALARKVGISVSYVSMLERGERMPPLDMVDKIAAKMKVPALDLLK
jgi:transcriptional regulator with XRE-family HTH domain